MIRRPCHDRLRPQIATNQLQKIYKFAIFRQYGNFTNESIKKAADQHELTTITFVQKLRAVWKDNYLNPTQKDVFYNLAFNLYRDRVFLKMQDTKQKPVIYLRKKTKRINTFYLNVRKLQKWRIDWDSSQQKIFLQRV